MKHSILLTTSAALAVLVVCTAALLGAPADSARAAFPGNNGRLAFSSYTGNNEFDTEIFTINPDGTGLTQLTSNARIDEAEPKWSPDGKRILYLRNRRPVGDSDLWVMNADGSGQTQLTEGRPILAGPTWSPDGSKVAFVSRPNGSQSDIYVMNADGSGIRRLTNSSATEYALSWSPDGTKIAIARDNDVYVMSANGGDATNLTNGRIYRGGLSRSIDWSPDGSKIAFHFYCSPLECHSVFIMEPDGSGLRRISNGGTVSWSPDGTQIAVLYGAPFETRILVMNPDGSNARSVTDNLPGPVSGPSWQPLPADPLPTTKSDCKKGGYKDFGFKNQGRCIKAVNRASRKVGA